MKETKPVEQAEQLINLGLIGDRNAMASRLAVVSFERLSGYWHPFLTDQERFKDGTTFEIVWERYAFDRRLRLLIFDAIERIEVCLKTQLSQVLDDWKSVEPMTFGAARRAYEALSGKNRSKVAEVFGVHHVVLSSWLESLLLVRNVVAHHGRLWNRQMGARPKIPNKDRIWHEPVEIVGDRLFGVLSICRYCLRKIAPQSSWQLRFEGLIDEFPQVPIKRIGVPKNWKESPIWA